MLKPLISHKPTLAAPFVPGGSVVSAAVSGCGGGTGTAAASNPDPLTAELQLIARNPRIQLWIRQQADEIARSVQSGTLQEAQLSNVIRLKIRELGHIPPELAQAVALILRAMVLRELLQGQHRANTDLQGAYQDYQRTVNTIVSIQKKLYDEALSIIANLRA